MIAAEAIQENFKRELYNPRKAEYEKKRIAYNNAVVIPERKKFDLIEFLSKNTVYTPSKPDKPAGPPEPYTGLSVADWTTKITNYGDTGGWGKLTKGEIPSLTDA